MEKAKLKNTIKRTVDAAMLLLLLYLMGYAPGKGLLSHAAAGAALIALFVLHHLLNAGYIRAVFRGSYNPVRALFALVNGLLCVAMSLVAISAVMISGFVFDVPFLPVRAYWRDVHAASASWGFLLTAFHLGLHTRNPVKKLRSRISGKPNAGNRLAARAAAGIFAAALFLPGAWCFSKSPLPSALLMSPSGVSPAQGVLFYAQYTAIIVSVCVMAGVSISLAERIGKGKTPGERAPGGGSSAG